MFKNRIRTAAIAGIAALATGLGAVVVPASAQDTLEAPGAPAGEYWVSQDASAAYEASPVNHTEEELKQATDEATRFIVEDVESAIRDMNSELDWSPSEEASAARVRELHDLIIAAQEQNSETINMIQESIAYAYDKDLEATEAWQALVERAHEINNELFADDKAPISATQADGGFWEGGTIGDTLYVPFQNGSFNPADAKPLSEFAPSEYANIIQVLNFYLEESNEEAITGLTELEAAELGSNPSDLEVIDFIAAFRQFVNNENVNAIYRDLGNFMNDGEGEGAGYYTRDFANLFQELYDEVNGWSGELNELEATSQEASREAQKSDVLVRQGFLARAIAQRNLLRNAEGYALAWARYIELYNDPTLTEDRTLLSTEYREVLDDIERGFLLNLPLLVQIDEAVVEAYRTWQNDLNTNADVEDIRDSIYDEWDFELVERRTGTAFALLGEIRANGAIWREALNRVQALEIELNSPSESDEFLDRLEDILNGTDDADDNDDDNNGSVTPPATGGGSSFDAPEFTGGSSDLGGFGIAAVIAAIIGVLALVVPNIQNFL